jgi:hypothetical protein
MAEVCSRSMAILLPPDPDLADPSTLPSCSLRLLFADAPARIFSFDVGGDGLIPVQWEQFLRSRLLPLAFRLLAAGETIWSSLLSHISSVFAVGEEVFCRSMLGSASLCRFHQTPEDPP